MGYQNIEVKPVAGSLGAEVFGADLAGELSNQAFDEIHQAFLDHQVLFIRDQKLTPQQQVAFGRRFGKPNIYPFVPGLDEAPEIFEILKAEGDEKNFGGAWHSDTTYLAQPPLATMLYAREVPPVGGDTLYANTYQAYEALSDGLKQTLAGLIGINSAALAASGGRANLFKSHSSMTADKMDEAEAMVAEHPVVRTHPQTGRKSLYLNKAHTTCFKGWAEAESKPLIDWLAEHITRPEFTCRMRWEVGTLGLWDNRCTQHYAVNDYPGQRRRMHRMTIEGEVPV